MRIVCPNCAAQYEVPSDAIPPEGRDVQCSNCGMTWLEKPEAEAGELKPVAFDDESAVLDDPTENITRIPTPEENSAPEPTLPPIPPRKELDPEVADILRQEADLEQSARDEERGGIETQPDLGLEDPKPEPPSAPTAEDFMFEVDAVENKSDLETAVKSKMTTMQDGPDLKTAPGTIEAIKTNDAFPGNVGDAGATAAALGARKQLLPDIEEINSSLQSTQDRDLAGGDLNPETPIKKRKRRGFRRGFFWAVLIIVVALLVYLFAPEIAQALPQVDPWLSAYVTWVDGLRAALDAQLKSFAAWLDTLAASAASSN